MGGRESDVSRLTDREKSRVLEVMEGHDREAADLLFATLPEEVRAALEGSPAHRPPLFPASASAVCSERSGPFSACAQETLPEADLGHDRYHISAHLKDAVAKVHRAENRRLQKLGDERLKGTERLFG